ATRFGRARWTSWGACGRFLRSEGGSQAAKLARVARDRRRAKAGAFNLTDAVVARVVSFNKSVAVENVPTNHARFPRLLARRCQRLEATARQAAGYSASQPE